MSHVIGAASADAVAAVESSPRCKGPYAALSGDVSIVAPSKACCWVAGGSCGRWVCVLLMSLSVVLVMPLALLHLYPEAWAPSQPPDPFGEGLASPLMRLHGSLQLDGGLARGQHLGGFCFGHTLDVSETAGMVWMEVRVPPEYFYWVYSMGIGTLGYIQVLIFDDQGIHWNAIQDRWETTTCEEKVKHANTVLTLNNTFNKARVRLHEAFSRQWHIAVVACNRLETAMRATNFINKLEYTVYAHQELSTFSKHDFSPSKCPGQPVQFLRDQLYGITGIMV